MQDHYGPVTFTSTGSTMLDLALGGGWADGRMVNLVGDKSSGKSLLAIEALACFHQKSPQGLMLYGEAEAAFDSAYAANLGFPDEVEMLDEPIITVEQWGLNVQEFMARCAKTGQPGLYVLDSCDALSSDAERARKLDDAATYGAEKPKFLSRFFRTLGQERATNRVSLMIISQVREDIGATYGDGLTRSGGKALDFYASQICWLKHKAIITKQVKLQQRAIGVSIGAKIKKNKTGFPFREADFDIIFGYGVDDELSMLNWLNTVGANKSWGTNDVQRKQTFNAYVAKIEAARTARDRATVMQIGAELRATAAEQWREIEQQLAPTTSKYGELPRPVPIPVSVPGVAPSTSTPLARATYAAVKEG